jgi:hypothetical protein
MKKQVTVLQKGILVLKGFEVVDEGMGDPVKMLKRR